jgi:signal transduction histidine kinase
MSRQAGRYGKRGWHGRLRELNVEVFRAVEDERRRIAGVLHDEIGQALAAVRMTLCELRASEASVARAGHLDRLRTLVEQSIEVTRSLTFQLSPQILYDLGLAAALQALVEQTGRDHGYRFSCTLGKGWSPPAEDAGVALYRAVRELLHNVTKHARATRVHLALGGTGDEIWISLDDDGVGFAATGRTAGGRGQGLFQVRERMDRLGGGFVIDSAPGRGTHARLTLPCGERKDGCRGGRRPAP